MFRKIILFLLLIAFGGLAFFVYTKMNSVPKSSKNYFASVPYQSVMIFDIKKPKSFFETITNTNLIYDEFKKVGWIDEEDKKLRELDSKLGNDLFFDSRWENTRMLASLVPTGKDKHSWLFSVLIPNQVEKQHVVEKIKNLFSKGKLIGTDNYDGAEIFKFKEKENWYATYHDGFVLISKAQMAVEDAVRQLNSGISLNRYDKGFERINGTAGLSKEANLYINLKYFTQFLSKFLNKTSKQNLLKLETIAGWIELDLTAKTNGISLNGYSLAVDTIGGFLSVFDKQSPQPINVIDILPSNTAFFMHYGIDDYVSFDNAYKDYLHVRNQLNARSTAIKELSAAGLNIVEVFKNQLKGEVALCITEIPTQVKGIEMRSIQAKTFGIIQINDKPAFHKSIAPILGNSSKTDSITTYRDIDICAVHYPLFLKQLFGKPFDMIACHYFMFIDDYAVFGNQLTTMRDFINNWKGNKSLSKQEQFDDFRGHLSDQSTITLYSNISRVPNFLGTLTTFPYTDSIANNIELFRRFGGFSLQIEKGNKNLYYNSIYLKHNPSYKNESSSLWELPLDTTLVKGPMLFTNHYTKAKEILVQDANGKIYLISNTGRVLWSRLIGEPIIGKINEVDRYQNGKYQLLFNTADKIYLLDRNGKNIAGFPIELKNKMNLPISVFDYDKNRNYRIFAPQKNGEIQCFDMEGEHVRGWKYKKNLPLCKPLTYMTLKNKDYLIGLSTNNNVRVLNRRGEDRILLKQKIKAFKNSSFTIEKGHELSSTYIVCSDSAGIIYRLSLTDKLETAQVKKEAAIESFQVLNFTPNNQPNYCFTYKKSIDIYDLGFDLLWRFESETPLKHTLSVARQQNKDKGYFSFTNENDKAFVYNKNFDPVEGTPFYGLGIGVISDVNIDGRLEYIVGSKEGVLYCYILE